MIKRPAFRLVPQDEWPAMLHEHYSVAGIAVGGCVDGGRWFRRRAHAHTAGEQRGWICFLSPKGLVDMPLLTHELAHILSGEGHTDGFRRALLNLRGYLEPNEHKRERGYPTEGGKVYRNLYRIHHAECPCRAYAG